MAIISKDDMPDNNSLYVIQVNSLVYVLKKTCTRIIVAIFAVERKKLETMFIKSKLFK